MSKKKSIIIIVVLIALAICCFVPAVFILRDMIRDSKDTISIDTDLVEVKDGVALSDCFKHTLIIHNDSEYIFNDILYDTSLPWENKGYVTGIVLKNEAGEEVHAVTAQKFFVEFRKFELKKGKYYIELSILTDEEQTEAFLKEHIKDYKECEYEDFRDGEWNMWYSCCFLEFDKICDLGIILNAFLILVELIVYIVAIIIDGDLKDNFDERQEIVRGKAFKYGFFAIIMYFVFDRVLIAADIYIPMDEVILLFVGILFGVGVSITYSIWNEGYVPINCSKKAVICYFSISILWCAVCSFFVITNELAIKDGKLALPSLNMICGIFFIYILAVLLVKMLVDKRNNE